jgi:rhodanese-related sulfurtransferase
MRKRFFVPIIVTVTFLFSIAVFYALATAEEKLSPVKISSKEVYEIMKNEEGWYIFDMRTNLNYIMSHMPQARSIPMFMLEKRMKEVPKNTKVILIFQNSEDAEKGWNLLIKNGYDNNLLRIFSDTMDKWVADGYPFEDTIPVGC